MKIAYILSRLANLGPFIVAQTLTEKLKFKVDKVDVFYIDEKISSNFTVPVKRVSYFSRAIDLSEYDICHSHGLKADLFVYLNRSKIRGKCITTLHQYNGEQLKYYYSNIVVAKIMELVWERFVSRHDLVVALSKNMMEYYDKKFGGRRTLDYVYNGKDIVETSPEIPEGEKRNLERLQNNHTVIGAAAGLTKGKGFDQLIRLLKKDENLFLLIIGDGREKENLMAMAKNLNVDNRCLFLGYKKNCIDYYRYFDIYAMTSYTEGFPLVLIEAAAMKIPAVCSDRELFREIFTEDEVAYFKLGDIDSLYESVLKIKNDRTGYAKKFYTKYTNNYTADKMADSYLNIYYRIIGA